MAKVYYKVLSNDGSEASKELKTLREARREKKDIIKEDLEEFGIQPGDIHYYIVKVIEYCDHTEEEDIE